MARKPPGRPSKAKAPKPADPRALPEPDPAFPVHEHIGRQLKAMFEEMVNEPVPDRLRELLDKLERDKSKR